MGRVYSNELGSFFLSANQLLFLAEIVVCVTFLLGSADTLFRELCPCCICALPVSFRCCIGHFML